VARRVLDRLERRNLVLHRTLVGNFLTALEMAGCSISVMTLNEELKQLLDHPARPVLLGNF
ncbi:MAG: dihydroxyacetone kinase subunit DhaK, partial [Acetobacteraceae bacterium]